MSLDTRLFVMIIISFVFAGCESMQQSYRETFCNYDGAYKKGMNDARTGQPMEQQVSAACIPEQRANTERGYREGYTAYLRNAPQRVEINVNHQEQVMTSNCQNSTDCGGTKSCRDRGDGVHLCLGGEARTGFCEFSTDCGPSLFCKKVENNVGRCM